MPIDFTCPHCGSQTTVDDRFAGQTGPCRACGAAVTIPGQPSGPFAAAAPPPRGGSSSSAPWIIAIIVVAGGALLVCGGILAALLLPAVQAAREAARRAQCTNNLKTIGLAMQNYADVYGAFPPAYLADENGKPKHSWRVLLLPYLEQQPLYDRYDFDEPWDGPNNRQLGALMPKAFACPSHAPGGAVNTTTSYAAISGPGTLFEADTSSSIASVTDGLSHTLMVAEATGAGIHWMEPRDLDVTAMTFKINGSPNDISGEHPGIAQAVLGDGSCHALQSALDAETLRILTTKAGGEPLYGNF